MVGKKPPKRRGGAVSAAAGAGWPQCPFSVMNFGRGQRQLATKHPSEGGSDWAQE